MRAAKKVPTDARLAATTPIGGIGPGCRSSTTANVRRPAAAAIVRPARRQIRPTTAPGRRTTSSAPTARNADPNRSAQTASCHVIAPRRRVAEAHQGQPEGAHPEDPEQGDPVRS